MQQALLHQIQHAADLALKSASLDEGVRHLATAFSLFSEEARRLEGGYDRLHTRFQEVQKELEHSNNTLRQKILELNTLSGYLHNILKNISQGILFINSEGTITTCNEAAQAILEKESNSLLFASYWDHFADDFFGLSIKHALAFGLSQHLTYTNLSLLSGQKKELEISTSYVYDAPKKYQGIILLFRDVTKMQKLQAIANRNDRMKELGEMAASVAHEVRNPLGGIRGYASLLFRDLEGSPHLQEMAGLIIEGTKTLERLVNSVLQFSRPIYLQPTLIDLSRFLKDICKFIKVDPSFPHNVTLNLHLSSEPLYAPIDKEFLHSALLNLLVNALQAMEENGGTLTISLWKSNSSATITVTDSGKGIDPKDIEKIFSPFFTTKEHGTGLGLSEAYKIIQAHLGQIEVRSQIGVGTTFTVTLPLKRS